MKKGESNDVVALNNKFYNESDKEQRLSKE